MYLIDTDWIADFLNGRQRAQTLLNSLAPSGLAISVMTYGEVYDGIEGSADPASAEESFGRLLTTVDVLELTHLELRVFAHIRAHLRRLGQLIETADLLIAATALRYDLTLVTRNRRHFTRVPGLRLYENEE